MEKQKEGTWEAAVKLPPGRYEYKLFVDNGWAEEPPCTVMIGGGCFKIILNGGQVPNHFGTRSQTPPQSGWLDEWGCLKGS